MTRVNGAVTSITEPFTLGAAGTADRGAGIVGAALVAAAGVQGA